MKYHLTFPDKSGGYWVEVHSLDRNPTYSSVLTMTDEKMLEIDKWVRENNLGTRMSFNMWKLKNQASLNWFILRWS
jgi:hypothetical protein